MHQLFSRSILSAALMTGALVAGLSASLPAAAVEAIPESCLRCKNIGDDGKFIMCLYDCLGSVKLKDYQKESAKPIVPDDDEDDDDQDEIDDNETDAPAVGRWDTKEIEKSDGTKGRVAKISSIDTFPFFFESVNPTLMIMKDKGQEPMIVIDVRPAALTGFSDRLLLQVDEDKIRQYRLETIWNGHAAVLRDQKILKAVKNGKLLTFRMEVFGAGMQTFSFPLKGSAKILRWLEAEEEVRS